MGSKQSVKTRNFIKVIKHWGLTHRGTKGSHQRWSKAGMIRPVIIQSGNKNIPEFHIRNNLRTIGKSWKEFFDTLDSL